MEIVIAFTIAWGGPPVGPPTKIELRGAKARSFPKFPPRISDPHHSSRGYNPYNPTIRHNRQMPECYLVLPETPFSLLKTHKGNKVTSGNRVWTFEPLYARIYMLMVRTLLPNVTMLPTPPQHSESQHLTNHGSAFHRSS
jgi:hypothetical protein